MIYINFSSVTAFPLLSSPFRSFLSFSLLFSPFLSFLFPPPPFFHIPLLFLTMSNIVYKAVPACAPECEDPMCPNLLTHYHKNGDNKFPHISVCPLGDKCASDCIGHFVSCYHGTQNAEYVVLMAGRVIYDTTAPCYINERLASYYGYAESHDEAKRQGLEILNQEVKENVMADPAYTQRYWYETDAEVLGGTEEADSERGAIVFAGHLITENRCFAKHGIDELLTDVLSYFGE